MSAITFTFVLLVFRKHKMSTSHIDTEADNCFQKAFIKVVEKSSISLLRISLAGNWSLPQLLRCGECYRVIDQTMKQVGCCNLVSEAF